MSTEELCALFEKHDDEFLEFGRIENPPSKRPDLCAMLLLESRFPETVDMVSAAEHDQVWFSPDVSEGTDRLTEDDVIYLNRCGVFWDAETNSLSSFV